MSQTYSPVNFQKRSPQGLAVAPANRARPQNWLERVWMTVAQRGRVFAAIPALSIEPLERAKLLATSLLSARGEASGAAVSQELLEVLEQLGVDDRHAFLLFVAEGFQADNVRLSDAARHYLATPTALSATHLAEAAEPPRQELLRRMNMAQGGTRALVDLRREIPTLQTRLPVFAALDADLRHLLASWFNRGFLELRQIDWHTPAAILEKLIAYEAVHEIQGWEDLRRRLAPDRRCFAFFHSALQDDPLIFVEVALVNGLAGSVQPLLERDSDEALQRHRAAEANTAIFYSISNCQDGLRGISFGNFLIKQVVEILRAELPGLTTFATLSPVPGFRRWLQTQLDQGSLPMIRLPDDARALITGDPGQPMTAEHLSKFLAGAMSSGPDCGPPAAREVLRAALVALTAHYLSRPAADANTRIDPVARFHLGNGARLERINWMANSSKRGMAESLGIMVNYLYDPARIEANHERFTREGEVARSPEVDKLLGARPRRGLWKRGG